MVVKEERKITNENLQDILENTDSYLVKIKRKRKGKHTST